jgi:hypothetical protein
MIGLAIMSVLIVVVCIVPQIDIINEYEMSENTIRLEGIQTPEHKSTVEKLKEQWLSSFNQLLNEFKNRNH